MAALKLKLQLSPAEKREKAAAEQHRPTLCPKAPGPPSNARLRSPCRRSGPSAHPDQAERSKAITKDAFPSAFSTQWRNSGFQTLWGLWTRRQNLKPRTENLPGCINHTALTETALKSLTSACPYGNPYIDSTE